MCVVAGGGLECSRSGEATFIWGPSGLGGLTRNQAGIFRVSTYRQEGLGLPRAGIARSSRTPERGGGGGRGIAVQPRFRTEDVFRRTVVLYAVACVILDRCWLVVAARGCIDTKARKGGPCER